ncbi:L-rhamnose mutarotase [Mesorhizobium sp. ES1-3]|nr:L-rhamnose mutarotase [Mesorhizobium sp. ES1-3]MBZ9673509.1 L-rhamnose mutarotase [Mesorhizobium sp. ES1-3]
MGLCIGLKAEAIAEYMRVHAAVWLEVLAVRPRRHPFDLRARAREPSFRGVA